MSDGRVRSGSDTAPASPANPRPGLSRRTFIGSAGTAAALAALGVPPWLTKPAAAQSPPSAGPQTYIGKQSMNPPAWPNTAPAWSHTAITPLSPSGGFSPVRLTTNNGTFSTPYPGFTEAVAVGDPLTYKIRVAPGATPGGVRVNYLASGATTSVAYCVDLTAANPVWNNIAAGTTLVSSSKLADGTTEAVFRTTVQDTTLKIGLSTATDIEGNQVDLWGLQVVRGDQDAPWQPVGNTTVVLNSVDLDFVAGSYLGGSLADLSLVGAASDELKDDGTTTHFNANVVRRTDLGVWVHGESTVYIGANSESPGSWTPNPNAGWAGIVVTGSARDNDAYSPNPVILQNDNGAGWLTPGLAPDVPIRTGDALTVKFRVKPKTAPGARIWIEQTDGGEQWSSSDLASANPRWVSNVNYTQYSPYSTLLGSTQDPVTGWVEVTIRFIVVSPDITFHLTTLGDVASGQIVIGGFQVVRGYSDRPWVATATSPVSVAADDLEVVAGSGLDSLLHGAQGWCGLELQALAHSTVGTAGWQGSTQGTLLRVGTQDVLKPKGPTGFQTLSGEGALGLSGWRGIVRIAIAWDAAGWSVFANGSKLSAGGAGVFSPAGAVKLLAGITGRLRRISADASRLADADLQAWTQLQNKTFTRPKNALVPGTVTPTYQDDYDGALTDSLRYQSTRNFPYASPQAMAQSYDSGGPNARWIPRAHFYTDDPTGMGPNHAINGEPEYYVDPREPGNWTGSHVVQGSCLELHLRLTSQLTASEQAKIPINPATGQRFKYVSGLMTTYGFFQQTFGVFSSRDQMPAFKGSWPAWWLYSTTGNQTELDIEEYYGQDRNTSTDTMHDPTTTPQTHDGSTYYAGYDLAADFHDRTCVWTSATFDKYLDGERVGHHVPTAAVNGSSMFLLYNFALYPQQVDPSTDTALANNPNPAIRIDRTTVLQFA